MNFPSSIHMLLSFSDLHMFLFAFFHGQDGADMQDDVFVAIGNECGKTLEHLR